MSLNQLIASLRSGLLNHAIEARLRQISPGELQVLVLEFRRDEEEGRELWSTRISRRLQFVIYNHRIKVSNGLKFHFLTLTYL